MADFEKTLLNFLAGNPLEETSDMEYDITIKDSPAMLRRNLTICVGAILLDEENNILLIQEAKQDCRGQWYLPAGRLDENELIEVFNLHFSFKF